MPSEHRNVLVVVGIGDLYGTVATVLRTRLLRKSWVVAKAEDFLSTATAREKGQISLVVWVPSVHRHVGCDVICPGVPIIVYDPGKITDGAEAGYPLRGAAATPAALLDVCNRMMRRKRGPKLKEAAA